MSQTVQQSAQGLIAGLVSSPTKGFGAKLDSPRAERGEARESSFAQSLRGATKAKDEEKVKADEGTPREENRNEEKVAGSSNGHAAGKAARKGAVKKTKKTADDVDGADEADGDGEPGSATAADTDAASDATSDAAKEDGDSDAGSSGSGDGGKEGGAKGSAKKDDAVLGSQLTLVAPTQCVEKAGGGVLKGSDEQNGSAASASAADAAQAALDRATGAAEAEAAPKSDAGTEASSAAASGTAAAGGAAKAAARKAGAAVAGADSAKGVQGSDPTTIGSGTKTPTAGGAAGLPTAVQTAEADPDSDAGAEADPVVSKPAASTTPADRLAAFMGLKDSGTKAAEPLVTSKAAAPAGAVASSFETANGPSIVSAVSGKVLESGGTITLRLDPPEMGALQVAVVMKNGLASVSFSAENPEAAQALTQSMGQLRDSLAAAGVGIEKFTVQHVPATNQGSGADSKSNGGSGDGSSGRNSSGGSGGAGAFQQQDEAARRDQQRRELLERLWRKTAGTDVSLVA